MHRPGERWQAHPPWTLRNRLAVGHVWNIRSVSMRTSSYCWPKNSKQLQTWTLGQKHAKCRAFCVIDAYVKVLIPGRNKFKDFDGGWGCQKCADRLGHASLLRPQTSRIRIHQLRIQNCPENWFRQLFRVWLTHERWKRVNWFHRNQHWQFYDSFCCYLADSGFVSSRSVDLFL
jgi:hypothetical protein